MSRLRVAIGQISSESNTFSAFTCNLDTIRATGYVFEVDGVFALRDTSTEVAGMLAGLADGGAEAAPLIAARWTSSAVVAQQAYEHLRARVLAALEECSPVDAVLLSCHGSMVAAAEDDPEGDLARAVRERVGANVPIAMTLDLHANVTARMVETLDLILGYETYPHVDAASTGRRAAELLLRTARGEARPTMAHIRVPMVLTAFHASTEGDGPFAIVMRQAKARERDTERLLSTSVFFVGSYIDVPALASSVLVIADGDPQLAADEARALAAVYWERRHDFLVETVGVGEAVRLGRQVDRQPVILLDTADTTGGGAAGDTIGLVAGLLEAGVTEPCLAMVVDPKAARACRDAGAGADVTVQVGHALDPRWGRPISLTGRVLRTTDGRFTYTGGIFGGTEASMGASAVLRVGSIDLLISSRPTYDFADEQYRSVGLRAEDAKFVQAKNMMNFRTAYGSVMKGFFVLDLPGPTAPDMRCLPFARRNRPCFPWDNPEQPVLPLTVSRT